MAITNYYVRATNGADVAGQGTTHMTAYQTPQFALDDIGATHGRNAVDGDQINICDEAACVLAAELSYVAYGVPTALAPLILRGYTAAANDGGRGVLNGNGGAFSLTPVTDHCGYIDLRGTNVNISGPVLASGHACLVQRCEVDTNANASGAGIGSQAGSLVAGCYIHDVVRGIQTGYGGSRFIGNRIHIAAPAGICFLNNNTVDDVLLGNIMTVSQANSYGYKANGANGSRGYFAHNIVYNSAAGTTAGILLNDNAGGYGTNVLNNIVCGWSGVGGVGIRQDGGGLTAGHNAFYNNTTDEQYAAGPLLDLGNDVALGADPFVDAANGDFSLTDAAKLVLRSAGWPASYLGAATDLHITIGAVQYGAAEAGGGAVSISPFRGNIG